ncbi:MAG: TetR/AcrR family transcriptional regulator [Notoacmeibacter sp.]
MSDLSLKKPETDERYHHGNLRAALIAAAEQELAESGPERFSLRACARRANVSHAAPAHHFGDAGGLLDALAALGFERLCRTMLLEMEPVSKDPEDQMTASAVGYVRFAVTNPHLFKLMFMNEMGPKASAELIANSERAFAVLVDVTTRQTGTSPLKTPNGWVDIAALWSAVHGYAHLLIGKKLTMFGPAGFDDHRGPIGQIALRSIANRQSP